VNAGKLVTASGGISAVAIATPTIVAPFCRMTA